MADMEPETNQQTPKASWLGQNPWAVSLTAGAFAGVSVEAVLFPLDCLKTRVQSPKGLWGSGGFRGMYRGLGTAMCGSAPASAIFFSTYEFVKGPPADVADRGFTRSIVLASVCGELAASSVRVPVDLMKQRLQAGYKSAFLLPMNRSIFLASFQATAMRDVTHSSIQYTVYEYLKLKFGMAPGPGKNDDPLRQAGLAAMNGSVAGMVSAILTTPFDLLKTRLNLRAPSQTPPAAGPRWAVPASTALVAEEIRQIYKAKGVRGFYTGASFRAAWMGLGGFVFLGSFELAKEHLSRPPETRARTSSATVPAAAPAEEGGTKLTRQQSTTASASAAASVSFAAGLVAGVAVDLPLHPLDTLKTRLQAREGFGAAGGMQGLWSGLSPMLIMSVPASAVFFTVYDQMQTLLEREAPVPPRDSHTAQAHLQAFWRDAVSASVADCIACVVRVPCEVVKQRMQTQAEAPSLLATMRGVNAEGFWGFFVGFGATVSREVPFALIQMPLFEALKQRHPWAESAQKDGDTGVQGLIGMTSGAVAGATAGFVTTPLDTAKTRIMITVEKAERRGLWGTLAQISRDSGLRGLFAGVLPRTVHSGAGGALWLGAFEWSKLLLSSC